MVPTQQQRSHRATSEADALVAVLEHDSTGRNGDDAAIIAAPAGTVCVTVDTAIEAAHLDHALTLWQRGYRAAACALSDLAAMAAVARGVVTAINVPPDRWNDVPTVTAGVAARAREAGCDLVGGDLVATSSEQMTISVTCIGSPALRRPVGYSTRGAGKPGDVLVLTGTLGRAAHGLAELRRPGSVPGPALAPENRYIMPPNRLRAARLLAPFARAAIDISDGIGGEVRRLATAAGCGASINLDLVANPWSDDANWGDDYELLLAIPPRRLQAALKHVAMHDARLALTSIGLLTAPGTHVVFKSGGGVVELTRGYVHTHAHSVPPR